MCVDSTNTGNKVAKKICDLLKLNITAGLGWRLAQLDIRPDAKRSDLFFLISNDDIEASTLAYALSVRAEALQLRNLNFSVAGA